MLGVNEALECPIDIMFSTILQSILSKCLECVKKSSEVISLIILKRKILNNIEENEIFNKCRRVFDR